jgi:hypothetical protein
MKNTTALLVAVLMVTVSCQTAPTPTPIPTLSLPTLTAIPPTSTRIPPTSTPQPTTTRTATPTSTPVRSTGTLPAPVLPPVPPPPKPTATKQIILHVVQGGYPYPARMVWMGYFDENLQTWMKTTGATDATGYAVFRVPTNIAGESFFFTFSGSDAELAQLCMDISNGRWSAFKIPSDSSQGVATLELDLGRLTIQVIQGHIDVRVMK